jgi:hypothetical protein
MERDDEDTRAADEELLEDSGSGETGPIDLQCSDGEALQRYEG